MARRSAREAAMRLFYQKDLSGEHAYDAEALQEMQQDFPLKDRDIEYIKRLLEIAEINAQEIDRYIVKYARGWKFSRLAKVDLAIMRVAICEMLFCQDIPHSVSINEAVELAKKYSDPKAPQYINGILASVLYALEPVREVD